MSKVIRSVQSKFTADISDFERQMQKLSKRIDKTADKLKAAGQKMSLYITAPILAIGGAMTKMAMDAVESENLFTESMGNMAADARHWSDQLSKSLGLNAYNIRKMVSTFNVMLGSMGIGEQSAYGMSKAMTQLAYDMASFYNLNVDEAFTKLQSGISGEVEPLKRLGIIVNETTVKNWALTNGIIKQGQQLSESQKIIARYNVIMEATSKAQGDMARTADSPSNQLRSLKEQATMAGISIGTKLLPVMQKLIKFGLSIVDTFTKLSPSMQTSIIVIIGITAAIGPLITGIGALSGALAFLIANPVVGLVALVAGLGVAAFAFGKFKDAQKEARDKTLEQTFAILEQKDALLQLNDAQIEDAYYKGRQQDYELMVRAQNIFDEMSRRTKDNNPMFLPPDQYVLNKKRIDELMKQYQEIGDQRQKLKKIYDVWENPEERNAARKSQQAEEMRRAIEEQKRLMKEMEGSAGAGSGIDEIKNKVKALGDELVSMTKKFTNFVGLFERAQNAPSISAGSWLNRLKKQVQQMTIWKTAMAALQGNKNVSPALLGHLQELGPEYAKQLQKLASASGSQLQQASSLYGQKLAIGSSAAVDVLGRKAAQDGKIDNWNFNITGFDFSNSEQIKKILRQMVKELKLAGV
jgi:hypothetical protein